MDTCPAKMELKSGNFTCLICLSETDDSQLMWPLFEVSIERETPADIILYCFGVELLQNTATNGEICTDCKSDLEAAHRFLKQLQQSVERFKDVIPKVEISVFDDDEKEILDEVEIKTENPTEYIEEIDESKNIFKQVHFKKHRAKDTSELDTSREKLPATSNRESQHKRPPTKPEDFLSSEDDHQNDESDYDQQYSSEDDDEYDVSEKPAAKQCYYGSKSNALPKRCCSCKEPLDTHDKVKKHSMQYHLSSRITNPKEFGNRVFECPVCYQRFDTKIIFLQHQRKMYVDKLHPCSRCEEEFANPFVLKKHLKFYHKKQFKIAQLEEMRSKANICCGCKERFSTSDALKDHVEKTHVRDKVLYETSNTFECDVCYHRFKTFKSLKHHQLRFFKEKKFVCTICGKFFREKARLAEHENLHRKIAPFLCAYCPAKFAIKSSYEMHVKMHDAEVIYNCEYCGKGFRKKSILMGHLQIHDTDRPFKCHLCPITFTRQNLLDAHLLAHSDSKPHKCQQCAASYIHQRDLRRHIREKHEGIRNFKCHLCPKAYIRQKLLETHLRTHDE